MAGGRESIHNLPLTRTIHAFPQTTASFMRSTEVLARKSRKDRKINNYRVARVWALRNMSFEYQVAPLSLHPMGGAAARGLPGSSGGLGHLVACR
jgi:hypothetical protein